LQTHTAYFSILIQQNVKAIFAIGLHKKDKAILEQIQSTLGVGKIHAKQHGKD